MKKPLLLIIAFLQIGFFGISQNKMPYYIMYQMDGDTVYRSLQSVSSININSDGQQLNYGNGTDLIPLSGLDTVTVFRDKLRKYVGEMADWDEVLFSMEQIHFYKENTNGQPLALFSFYMNDSIPEGYFIYTEFDEEGHPEYTNLNDSCVLIVSDVYGDYFNAVVIDKNMSSTSMDSVPILGDLSRIYGLRAWQDLSPALQVVVSRQSYMGGISMLMGGVTMAVGCSMIIPGVNVAVGMAIALGGAASFISGALLAARATDQMLSDGTHTEGFEEYSRWVGLVGAVASGAAGGVSLAQNLAFYVASEGGGYVVDTMFLGYENELFQAAINRALEIRDMELTATGRASLLDLGNNSVRLYGNISEKLNPIDWFGIMIFRDSGANIIEDLKMLEASHPTGSFYCDFSDLEPVGDYYYRSCYYSTELANFGFNPYVVTNKKSFRMPGVVTLAHELGNSSINYYWLHGKFQDVANQPIHTVGFCYSYINEKPTYDDEIIEQTVYDNGNFIGHLFMNSSYDVCYYRAYAFINGEIAYGEVKQISSDEGDWVDLGLPSGLLWATRNVGANSPEEYGNYISWGESAPKSVYRWYTYNYGYEDEGFLYITKYNTDSYYGPVDNLTILQSGDDAATVNWGSDARVPTIEEWLELMNYCTTVWTSQNGVSGRCFTGPNGNSLFLPAAGCRLDSNLSEAGNRGNYWSSSLYTSFPLHAWNIYFDTVGYGPVGGSYRDNGLSIRAVRSARQY